jgi:hypothetical protein
MSISGTVTVKDDKYHPRGEFHRIEPNTPIRDADQGWRLLGVTNPREMVYIHSYGGEAPFLRASAGAGCWPPGVTTASATCTAPSFSPFASTARSAWGATPCWT